MVLLQKVAHSMSKLAPLLWIALIGLACYLLITFIPMPYPFPTLIVVCGIIASIVVILKVLGVWDRFVNS
jgi:hypothetical protein